jgi:hypothetical protein
LAYLRNALKRNGVGRILALLSAIDDPGPPDLRTDHSARKSESTSLWQSSPDWNEHMPDEHKTLEQRIPDLEFNLKKLREEITNAYISRLGKMVLAEQSPTQPLAQTKKKP